ncbi:MAG: preprotein translocase subunit YajC [Tissierellaceae bacterium]|jgi:preprotein translocase subunit YajC|nr:preprotein translocase subunit YajC [Tissierellia bacterium]
MPEQLQAMMLPIGLLVVFYFFAIRPQKKREKEIQAMREGIKVGDEIITIGGILGKVVTVKDDQIIIEVGATKTRLELTKWSVGSVTNKKEE